MNKERLKRIVDQIEKHPERFDMREFHGLPSLDALGDEFGVSFSDFCHSSQSVGSCGTKHCIAGWAQILWARDKKNVTELTKLIKENYRALETVEQTSKGIPTDAFEAGMLWLGLDYDDAYELFYNMDLTTNELKEMCK